MPTNRLDLPARTATAFSTTAASSLRKISSTMQEQQIEKIDKRRKTHGIFTREPIQPLLFSQRSTAKITSCRTLSVQPRRASLLRRCVKTTSEKILPTSRWITSSRCSKFQRFERPPRVQQQDLLKSVVIPGVQHSPLLCKRVTHQETVSYVVVNGVSASA